MRIKFLTMAGLLALAVAPPAHAQTAIAIPSDAAWKHAQTGLTLPASVIGIARSSLADNGGKQLDVMAGYGDGQATVVTLYVFRPALASVPMWFDRSEAQIMLRDVYGNPTAPAAAAAFAPPRGTATSALRRMYVPGKGPFKATGLAIMPLGDWLVAVRISSQELDAAALDAKLDEVIKAFGWPDKVAEGQPAVTIAPCTAPLAYSKKAKLKAPNMMDALLGATLSSMVADEAEKGKEGKGGDGKDKMDAEKANPITWCREGSPTQPYGTYRAIGLDTGYTIAIGDAGVVIDVNTGLAALINKESTYQLKLELLDRTLVYPSFDKLPTPDAAIAAVKGSSPISSVERGTKNVVISTGTVK